jgi:hypothetical protein
LHTANLLMYFLFFLPQIFNDYVFMFNYLIHLLYQTIFVIQGFITMNMYTEQLSFKRDNIFRFYRRKALSLFYTLNWIVFITKQRFNWILFSNFNFTVYKSLHDCVICSFRTKICSINLSVFGYF